MWIFIFENSKIFEEVNAISQPIVAFPESIKGAPQIEDKTIQTLMGVLYEKSTREEEHSQRVSYICFAIGEKLGFSYEQKIELAKIGLLHDIGKIAVLTEILSKPESLSSDEWQEIHQHPEMGYQFLSLVVGMNNVAETVWAHHERWDGSGYPRGLRGREIPLEARIVAVADAYDAMISTRPYRKALSSEKAQEELRSGAKKQFDPEIVNAFLQLIENDGH